MTNLDTTRIHGDVMFFTTGQIDDLDVDSSFTAMIDRQGYATTVYSDLIKEIGLDDNTYNFEHFFKHCNYEGELPSISRVVIDEEKMEVRITFTQVSVADLPYEIQMVIEAFGLYDYKLRVSGLVSDYTPDVPKQIYVSSALMAELEAAAQLMEDIRPYNKSVEALYQSITAKEAK